MRPIWREEAHQLIDAWKTKNPAKEPQSLDFGLGEGQIHVSYSRLVGNERYSPGNALEYFSLYASPVQFWLDRKQRDPSTRLLDVMFQGLSKEEAELLRPLLRDEAHSLINYWKAKNPGQEPIKTDFGSGEGQIPMFSTRLMGTDKYSPGKALEDFSLYTSPVEFWLDRKQRDPSTRLLDVMFQGLSKEEAELLRPIWREEAHQLIDAWKAKNPGKEPTQRVFGKEEGKIPISHARLMGSTDYSPRKIREYSALYNSREEYEADRKLREGLRRQP